VDDASLKSARAAKKRALEVFSEFGDIVGIGLTTIDDQYGLKVNFSSPPRNPSAVPSDVDGVPVRVEVVGSIRKQSAR
jgi:hypothetical protein